FVASVRAGGGDRQARRHARGRGHRRGDRDRDRAGTAGGHGLPVRPGLPALGPGRGGQGGGAALPRPRPGPRPPPPAPQAARPLLPDRSVAAPTGNRPATHSSVVVTRACFGKTFSVSTRCTSGSGSAQASASTVSR